MAGIYSSMLDELIDAIGIDLVEDILTNQAKLKKSWRLTMSESYNVGDHKCPECGEPALIPEYAWENMRRYHNDIVILADCCNKIINIKVYQEYELTKGDQSKEDDWGDVVMEKSNGSK